MISQRVEDVMQGVSVAMALIRSEAMALIR